MFERNAFDHRMVKVKQKHEVVFKDIKITFFDQQMRHIFSLTINLFTYFCEDLPRASFGLQRRGLQQDGLDVVERQPTQLDVSAQRVDDVPEGENSWPDF